VLAGAEIDGKQYGLPMRGVQPVLMYGNKEVLTANGIDGMPATWDELLADVATLKSAGLTTPIALAGSQSWTELMWAEYLLDRVAGPEVFQAIRDGEGQGWNDPAVLEAMTMLKQLIDAGAFGTANDFSATEYDAGGTTQLLANGDAAFHLMGSWEFTNQKGTNPDFVSAGNLLYAPFPAIEGGAGDPCVPEQGGGAGVRQDPAQQPRLRLRADRGRRRHADRGGPRAAGRHGGR
jgi:xylobiose transport system substrate-binding protein